jgi:OOP family OmpA-OmpF porin
MMGKFRLLAVALALLSLTSCAAYTARVQLDALNKAVPSGSPFTQRLTIEYRDLANYDETELMSYVNAEHFSRKGLKSAKGEIVPPENPSEWHISPNDIDNLLESRQKLVDLLDNGGREDSPDMAAVAQARFDCWVERSEKGDVQDVDVCRSQFEQALSQISSGIAQANAPAKQMPGTGSQYISADALHEAMFLVFFDWNKATITKTGAQVIDTVVSEAQRLGAHGVDITGFTDLSGTDKYNLKLSMKRAAAVKAALIKRGINASTIQTAGKGETSPIVATGKGVKEPANRRAEIRFE